VLADPLTGVPAGVLTIVTVGTVKLQNVVNQITNLFNQKEK